ncbi:MAG: flagellar basal body P-ring formation protein FlgA [Myxococcales bacterium]|nr:flagellar basal body P-ring formation protein FlgA [Myxococcales bacterium]
MNRTIRSAFVLVTTLLAGLIVCSSAGANQSLAARVHDKIEQFLQSRASARVNRLEIPDLEVFNLSGVSPADVNIKLRTRLVGELLGRVPVTVIISHGSKELKRAVVTASLKSVVPVLVASRAMRRGEVVTEDDFYVERRDVSVMRGAVISRERNLLGMRLRRSITAGRVWQPRHIESVPKVMRGEMVRIRLESGGLRIDSIGKASEDGRVGDLIRVLNASKRYVTGRVDAEGTIHVRF